MNLLEAVFLGFVQGVAEFLPISSSGHLAIFENVFGLSEVGMAFDILLHLGTLLAVFVVYWKDISRLIFDGIGIITDIFMNAYIFSMSKFRHGEPDYRKIIRTKHRKFALLIIISTIPTGILGIVFSSVVEKAAAGLLIPGICLLITGVLLLISDTIEGGVKKVAGTKYRNAFLIGIVQGIAILPGLSRSGSTITAGLLSGFDRTYAVKYSFILSIPAILGASVLELGNLGSENLSSGDIINYLIGMLVAAIIGFISIKTMLVLIRKKKFKFFAFYCFFAGTVAIIANFMM
ncbi:undecaprenyl-diphosphate phosphatase [Parasporobacterium paucivorans]|uniref:Undecaprenyl-diphosphatase n=1 Tax=Parasporobacterium paucivorans DSM 15970 TaxID=1122934 RepID=A0A1M6ET17_9FIRM|nr:undecaprenyl-diphosphate phosphatase [Parasporobacterium paucivorans]SHI88622.1 undecaprenyl-diphosphatase [Parasporobacterium paucivorans DSM 15970]